MDFDEGGGVERHRYNSHHYMVSETFWADGPRPITFAYDRDATTNVVNGATMSCIGLKGTVTRPVRLTPDADRSTKLALMGESYLSPDEDGSVTAAGKAFQNHIGLISPPRNGYN